MAKRKGPYAGPYTVVRVPLKFKKPKDIKELWKIVAEEMLRQEEDEAEH
jgi:hypothetical protein